MKDGAGSRQGTAGANNCARGVLWVQRMELWNVLKAGEDFARKKKNKLFKDD